MRSPAWLFVRGSESIWLQRSAERELTVLGPGTLRHVYAFESVRELVQFQVSIEQRLVGGGWVVEAFNPERRGGGERRQATRGNDRRRR